jgi:feruloyl-CoA synthase
VTPGKVEDGFLFDGRVTEDFKLQTGTWVSVGPLRGALVAALQPLVKDAVIAGHDRDAVTAIVFPDAEACRAIGDAAARAAFAEKLAAFAKGATGSSNLIRRVAIETEPPSLEAGEITDKGSLNQRAVLKRRAAVVEALYAATPAANVISV